MECRKNRFEPANEPVEADFFLLILSFVHVSTHIIGFEFWTQSAMPVLLSVSVSDILFNPCGVFPFLFLAANIVAARKLQTTSAVRATTMAPVSSILRKRGRVSRSCHTHEWRNH